MSFEILGGRKFTITIIGIFVATTVPIAYKYIGISDAITQIVIGVIATAIGTYGFTNVLADKYYKPDPSNTKETNNV